MILNEGDRTDTLYVILEGRVKIFVADADGNEVVFHTQGPREYFGELTLDEGPRSVSTPRLRRTAGSATSITRSNGSKPSCCANSGPKLPRIRPSSWGRHTSQEACPVPRLRADGER